MTLLQVEIERSGYGKVPVLHQVSLRVDPGEFVAVLGNNGVGKTTLLRAISGAKVVTRGSITFDGKDLSRRPAHSRCRVGVVHVPEGRHVFRELSVEDNLRTGALHAPKTAPPLARRLERVYELFPILADRSSQTASALSGGEQQMLAIGRGLMGAPSLLMVDEASLGLAPIVVKALFDTLVEIQRDGIAVLVVEQNIRTSLAHAERGYVLERGRVTQEGAAQDLLADPALVEAYLGKAAE